MDRHIGDLHPAIVGMSIDQQRLARVNLMILHLLTDREIEIVQQLLDKVLLHKDTISQACDVCAELDCLLSFAEATRIYGYRRPTMTEENVLCIRQGRSVPEGYNMSNTR